MLISVFINSDACFEHLIQSTLARHNPKFKGDKTSVESSNRAIRYKYYRLTTNTISILFSIINEITKIKTISYDKCVIDLHGVQIHDTNVTQCARKIRVSPNGYASRKV